MNLYIIGGRPCSGKTTFAHRIGEAYNIDVMYLDVFAQEMCEKDWDEDTELYKWKNQSIVEILQDSPYKLYLDYLKFYDELFPLFVEKIKGMQFTNLVIESSMLLPRFMKVLESVYDVKIVYLKTSDEFVNEVYPKRDYSVEFSKTEKGLKALYNLLERDSLFAKSLYKDAIELGYKIIEIKDNTLFDDAFVEAVKYFDIECRK